MSSNAIVLAHHETLQPGSRLHTRVPLETADLLVRRMAAERISRRVVRLFPPDHPVFLPARDFPQSQRLVQQQDNPKPLGLGELEVHGIRFVLSEEKVVAWRAARNEATIASLADYKWSA